MEITTDILLKGIAWNKVLHSEFLLEIFKGKTNYMLYMLSLSIGIMYDKRIQKPDDSGEEVKYVPRNVILNNDNGRLDFMFQAAILTTKTETLTEDERLELAFGEKIEFKKLDFLTQFANFGVTKILDCIGNTTLETMENLKDFFTSIIENETFEINNIIEDYLLLDK